MQIPWEAIVALFIFLMSEIGLLIWQLSAINVRVTLLQKSMDSFTTYMATAPDKYLSIKDGSKIETKVDALHLRVDSHERLLAGIKAEIMMEINSNQR